MGRTSRTKERLQGRFSLWKWEPKATFLAARCWCLAAVPGADDILCTFCQGGGCGPSTAQMKQPWGAGCQHRCLPTPNLHSSEPPGSESLRSAGNSTLGSLKVKNPLAGTFKVVLETHGSGGEFKSHQEV